MEGGGRAPAILASTRRVTFNGLHGVIFKKTELSLTTDVRTQNLTQRCKLKGVINFYGVFLEGWGGLTYHNV
jgi:hypothetical protein